MTLLRQIQDAAIATADSATDLLRRCKVLAFRLGSAEFGAWVERELSGYPSKDTLPDYRVAEVRSLGTFVGFGGSGAKNAPIPPSNIPDKWREHATTAYMMQPIGSYEDLLRSGKSGTFQAPWPNDLIKYVSGDIYQYMNLVSAWQEIPRGVIVALLDAVRNRVLSFALEIERVAPNAGEMAAGASSVPKERVEQVFQTIIYGNVSNVAAGAGISQAAESLIVEGDFTSLSRELANLGFSEGEVKALNDAVSADSSGAQKKLGKSVGAWIGTALGKAGDGLLKVSVNTASTLLPKLIGQYLGLPPG